MKVKGEGCEIQILKEGNLAVVEIWVVDKLTGHWVYYDVSLPFVKMEEWVKEAV